MVSSSWLVVPSGAVRLFVRYLRYELLLLAPSSDRATKSLLPIRLRMVDHFSSCTLPRAFRVIKVVCSELGACGSPLRTSGVLLGCMAGLFVVVLERALRQKLAIIPVARRGVMLLVMGFPVIRDVGGAASV